MNATIAAGTALGTIATIATMAYGSRAFDEAPAGPGTSPAGRDEGAVHRLAMAGASGLGVGVVAAPLWGLDAISRASNGASMGLGSSALRAAAVVSLFGGAALLAGAGVAALANRS